MYLQVDISVVVSGNITIGDNGNWFSDGEDTGIPATPAVDEQIDNIITNHDGTLNITREEYGHRDRGRYGRY